MVIHSKNLDAMKIIDISWPINSKMTQYKDRQLYSEVSTKSFEYDGVRESCLTIGTHVGTHVDAPSHVFEDGKAIESISLSSLIGKCIVLDFSDLKKDSIEACDLENKEFGDAEIILLKTKNSDLDPKAKFNPEFVFLAHSSAGFLSKAGIKAVGIDYLGIERNQKNHPTHKTLMGAGISIIEGLRLAYVGPGEYNFFCLPLAVSGLDASPARAILVK